MKKIKLLCCLFAVTAACSALFLCACDTHTHEYVKTVVPATCSEMGFTLYVCSCGDTYKDDYVNMLAHTPGEWITDTEATCTASGDRHKECTVCHTVIERETIPALGHKFNKKDTDEKYLFSPATCTKKAEYYYSCVCGKKGTEIFECGKKLPHSFTEKKAGNKFLKSPATCTRKAEYYYSCECGEKGPKTFEYGETLPHTFTEKKAGNRFLKSPATCTEKAEYYYSCVCGEKGTETFEYGEVNLNNHDYKEEVIPPTKTEDGYSIFTCTRCTNTYKDKVVYATGSEGLIFSRSGDGRTCSVRFGSCTDKDVFIPKKLSDGCAVTEIGVKAFENCSFVTSITIPDTIKSIGYQAFYGCSGLTEIHIPSSVTKIGTEIFYKASRIKTVYYDSTYASLDNSFLNMPSITKVVIGAKRVLNYLLYKCDNVKEVILKSGVESVGDYAFWDCTKLTSINIPDSVTSIGLYAFSGCYGLKNVNYIGEIDKWAEIDFYDSSSNPLSCAENLYINDELVSEITLTNVTKISSYAFEYCRSLTSINIPDSVTSIGERSFDGCKSLTRINLPDGVTSIGNLAFGGCSSLTSINIPDGVTSIGKNSFSGCSSLTSISIPNSVTSIGYSAFSNCASLTSITMPNSVMDIEGSAFYGCSSLTSINLPEGVTSIGDSAFSGCTSLVSINIPDSVWSIGKNAFNGCSSLKIINYKGDKERWDSISKGNKWNLNTGTYKINYNYKEEN